MKQVSCGTKDITILKLVFEFLFPSDKQIQTLKDKNDVFILKKDMCVLYIVECVFCVVKR